MLRNAWILLFLTSLSACAYLNSPANEHSARCDELKRRIIYNGATPDQWSTTYKGATPDQTSLVQENAQLEQLNRDMLKEGCS